MWDNRLKATFRGNTARSIQQVTRCSTNSREGNTLASIQTRTHSDGTTSHRVLWRQDGKQKSLTFVDVSSASRFKTNVEIHGPEDALNVLGVIDSGRDQLTLSKWMTNYVDGLTGIQEGTRTKYRGFIDRDFAELADLPLVAITEASIGRGTVRETV